MRRQIRENNPPETKKTYECLTEEGYSKMDALELIGGTPGGYIDCGRDCGILSLLRTKRAP